MTDAADHAIALTQLGYACYPVSVGLEWNERKQKHVKVPTFKAPGWQKGEYPTDPDEIREHWRGFDGIAINCERSGVVGVDIDFKDGVDGAENLAAAGVKLPPTPVRARSASGGLHGFYRVGSIPVETSASKLAKGVDIRAIGGIMFASPTVVEGLGAYEWTGELVPVDELPTFPDAVAESLRKPTEFAVPTADERPLLTLEQRERMQRRFETLLQRLRLMQDGERNGQLRRTLIRLVGISMSLGDDPRITAQLARDAYYESGGTDTPQIESQIEWAEQHAQYELPEEETDEAFEAEVAQLIRRARIQEEAKLRLNPLRADVIEDSDILVFDPDEAEEDYWVEGLIPKGETVLLFGESTAGKSFAAVDMAMGLASGRDVWGRPTRPARVLYLAGEGTRRLALRKKAWEEYHGISPSGIQFRKMKLLLASDESVAANRNLVDSGPYDVVVVDTFIRASEGLVLENPGEASRCIAQLDRLRATRPETTVVALHHPAKSNPDQPAGSYPIRGNVDTILKIRDQDGIRFMSQYKSKEGDQSWTAAFELQDVRIPGTRLSSAVFVPSAPMGQW